MHAQNSYASDIFSKSLKVLFSSCAEAQDLNTFTLDSYVKINNFRSWIWDSSSQITAPNHTLLILINFEEIWRKKKQ